MIMITHDLGVVVDMCDTVAVVYAGEVVEYGTLEDIFDHPLHHPYTVGLFNALPSMSKDVKRLSPIDGLPPDPSSLPKGCSFAPRCPYATEICHEVKPGTFEVSPGHTVRCNRFEKEA